MPNKINILTSDVYNRISAGEVVENPASVVKELIENALDAGATSITIEISGGGIKLIKITDNGSGIEREDLPRVFLPHATSKISKASDLDSILTLGFRGEALASIASVAQVEIVSKTNDSAVGGKITISGGQNQQISDCGAVIGTTITVKNLFFNTPARLKFLKSNKHEENLVTNIVNRLMLANPEISFKYIVEGKIIYNSVLNGLTEKVFMIYGKETVDNLIPINYSEDYYSLNGFISKPTFCKSNKTYQTLIVNGRYVNNSLVSVAIVNAYENFLMKGKFPLFILNFKLKSDDIDVNVHPSKMEVKFREPRQIYQFFYSTILNALNDDNSAQSILGEEELSFFEDSKVVSKDDYKQISGGYSFIQSLKEELEGTSVYAPDYESVGLHSNTYVTDALDYSQITSPPDEDKMNFNFFSKENINFDPLIDEYPVKKKKVVQEEIDKPFYNIVGTLFSTYVIIEIGDTCYFIDQHAGHERVLFDKLMEDYDKNKVVKQDLLLPYVFEVNPIEKNLVEENLDVFENLGFEVESFGENTYKINSIPHMLSGINLSEFIKDALREPNKISKTNEEIKNRLARSACRSAVKSGDLLSGEEIDILLNLIMKQDRVLLCPHGRPICIKFSKYEIEKMFKRVV